MLLRKRSGDVPGLFFLRRVLLRRGHWGGRGRNRGPEKVFSRSAFGGAGKGEGASGEFLSEGAGRACAARAEAFRRSSAGRPQRRSGALPGGPKKGALETAMPDASPAGRARSPAPGENQSVAKSAACEKTLLAKKPPGEKARRREPCPVRGRADRGDRPLRRMFGGAGKGEGTSGEFLSEGAGRACAARAEAFRRSSAGRPQRRSGALPEGPKKGALETAMPDASPSGRARSIHVGPCLLPGISRGAGAVFCRSGVRRQEPGRGKADAAARRQQGAEGRSALDQFSAAWRFSQRRISFIFLRRTR